MSEYGAVRNTLYNKELLMRRVVDMIYVKRCVALLVMRLSIVRKDSY